MIAGGARTPLEELAQTLRRVADRYLVPVELIQSLYSHQLRRGRALHRIGIRQSQWSQLVKQSPVTLLIWLGRNALGQTNNPPRVGRPAPIERGDHEDVLEHAEGA